MFELEFSYFSGCEWCEVSVKIQATSKIQLIKCFLNEVVDLHEYSHNGYYKEPKHLWNKVKDDIEIIGLPIITRKRW